MNFLRDWGPSPSHWILPCRLRLSRYKVVQLSCLFVLIPLMLAIETTPDSGLKDGFVLISILKLLREIADL